MTPFGPVALGLNVRICVRLVMRRLALRLEATRPKPPVFVGVDCWTSSFDYKMARVTSRVHRQTICSRHFHSSLGSAL
jgi:hypothetical protein